MSIPALPLLAQLARELFGPSTTKGRSPALFSEVIEDRTSQSLLARIWGDLYRIARIEAIGQNMFLGLLGARYGSLAERRFQTLSLHSLLVKEQSAGRFHLLMLRFPELSPTYLPLLTLLESHAGEWHLVESLHDEQEAFWAAFTIAAHLITHQDREPARFDDFGDFLPLGAPCIVQRHSTERLQKHLSRKVTYAPELCNHCLRCATLCNEMRVLTATGSAKLLGPLEDFCTNCGLCQKRCVFLNAQLKAQLPQVVDPTLRILDGGLGITLYGALASAYLNALEGTLGPRLNEFPYAVRKVFDDVPDSLRNFPIKRQLQLTASGALGFLQGQSLLVTVSAHDAEPLQTAIVRRMYRAGLVLQTQTGEIERQMAYAAMKLGVQVQPVVDADSGQLSVPNHDLARAFSSLGHPSLMGQSLRSLWENRKCDLILAPFAERLPAELHRTVIQKTGRQDHILSPHILQALPFTKNPLLGQLGAEFARIFFNSPELIRTEADYAKALLRDIQRNHALIHARYRRMALASGHSACPSCAEAEVLALPVYMAIAMSLARGELPQVYFTCETGCMSETLNKVGEVALKVPGGRTVFGGGFAFGEAIAMVQDQAVRKGYLSKGRRYIVSQSGDGGAVIGLPAWLNALRQQAYLVRQRHPNALHFITITDTQVYSNTGGESSASSLLGMGTLTTPIGKFLLGNQRIQWTLINLAAEFPGILVGAGHSGNRTAMQEFWMRADQLGQSAIRWDITPCPETGKFFGEDPDDLAEIMAHAGMIPEVVFVGRLRKRIAPLHPDDRNKPYREWRLCPKPIRYWLERDPRYRSLFRKHPATGKPEPRNLTSHFLIAQLESCRDQLNWQIDLETKLVFRAEEWVSAFFRELKESRKHYRHQLEQFPYAMLFNREGGLKPEYDMSLEQEMVRRILGWDELSAYIAARDRSFVARDDCLERLLAALDDFEKESTEQLATWRDASSEATERLQNLERAFRSEVEAFEKTLATTIKADSLEEELFAHPPKEADTLPEVRRKDLYALLDRLIEERGLAKQVELQQYRLAQQLKHAFLTGSARAGRVHAVPTGPQRDRLLKQIRRFGPVSIGVASLAGDRGIAINRIFASFFTAKGSWAGMAWQFGSSKRGTPVLSATFIEARPIRRKDAMISFPMIVLTLTNFEEMKRQAELFFSQLHPFGFLIINHQKNPEALWQELLDCCSLEVRDGVREVLERGIGRLTPQREGESLEMDASHARAKFMEEIAQGLWERSYSVLTPEQQQLAGRVAALVGVRVVSIDMDGIIQSVTGSDQVVSNLVAVAPMFQALQELGFPFEWDDELKTLTAGFPAAVLKDALLLDCYYQAMELARKRWKVWCARSDSWTPLPMEDRLSTDDETVEEADEDGPSSGESLMVMGGTLAGILLSQLATAEHPLFYVGFPITPAGNPFYAMAEAFANGHPYIVVDEVNPSEKVAAEKLLGIARTGCFLPVTFTASQGWRLFTEIIPQFVGARLEGLFIITKRALAAPNLNIEESHTDFMSFRDDGGMMLAPKSIQEYVPALYLARLLTHFAKLPVILSIGGITDTHKIGPANIPADERVRAWLKETLAGFDFLEHKLLNRQGQLIVHGPSGTSAVYQETQSEIEKAHLAATRILPYALKAVQELTGVWLGEIEVNTAGPPEQAETLLILQGSLYPNAVEALRELKAEGWRGLACLSLRCFNPFPEDKLFAWFAAAKRIVVLDRSNSFGSIPPLASRVWAALARFSSFRGSGNALQLRTLVGGLGGREITVKEMREILISSHLLFSPPQSWEPPLIEQWLKEDEILMTLLDEAAALDLRNTNRHTRVPAHLRTAEFQEEEYRQHRSHLEKLLVKKNYSSFLANYHQVEIVGAREVLAETLLLRQIVLRLETGLARYAFQSGMGSSRHAMILLHYSRESEEREMARSFLEAAIQAEVPSSHPKESPCAASQIGHPASNIPNPKSQIHHPESEILPSISFDLDEAQRIESVLAELVSRQGTEPLLYNPEDYEHELLHRLQNDPRSSLFELRDRCPADQADRLLWDYQCCYRDTIDRTLQKEILTQHHAPELRELFEGDGMKRLRELKRRMELILIEEPPEKRWPRIGEEIEHYLLHKVLPDHPRSPLFYLDFYRTWIAPELETLENVSPHVTPAQAGVRKDQPVPPIEETGFLPPQE